MTNIESLNYDAIIVGAGAGGGVVAGVLAEAGKRVLVLERGRWLTFEEVGRDHLRNQRLPQYGYNAGPSSDAGPRVAVNSAGQSAVVPPLDGRYQNNAACVGSGTVVYGAQAWRFLPDDFRMATRYGVPEGSSLADWPVTYEDLSPYYERVEWEMGVAGDAESSQRFRPQHRAYPMPPLPLNAQGQALRMGASALGWDTQTVPLLINSVPYNGRAACVHCQHCVGFACPTDAKNGTQNTLIARALATGLCTLETKAMAERIDTDPAGHVLGVTYWNQSGVRISAKASVVICSAGAIETPRLLLNSHSPAHPYGLGNACDQVGRHLQGHCYAGAIGWMPEPIWDGIGPGATTATLQFNHGNDGFVGGGMLADDFIEQPINFVKRELPGLPTWGLAHKQWVRRNYIRMLRVCGPVQEIPNPDSRVCVDGSVRDRWGIPVARLSGTIHPETQRVHAFLSARAEEWLQASGAAEITRNEIGTFGLSAGQHQAGTCRMGDDPETSVTDSWGRVHGHDNLFVADGSLHVTNGGLNPVLTILALAFRVAEGISAS
jgi:choline dehydrogenase-like flavoprotein